MVSRANSTVARVRAVLALKGLNQGDLAHRLGISQSQLSKMMREGCFLRANVDINDVAEALGVQTKILLSGESWPC